MSIYKIYILIFDFYSSSQPQRQITISRVGNSVENYKDYEALKSYIENATKEMDVSEIEEFYRKFVHIGGINDSIREFMTKYIPKINSNLALRLR